MYILNGQLYNNTGNKVFECYTNVVAVFNCNENVIFVTRDKKCYGYGMNKANELGLNSIGIITTASEIKIENITCVVMRKFKTLFLTSNKKCYMTSMIGLLEIYGDFTSAAKFQSDFIGVTSYGDLFLITPLDTKIIDYQIIFRKVFDNLLFTNDEAYNIMDNNIHIVNKALYNTKYIHSKFSVTFLCYSWYFIMNKNIIIKDVDTVTVDKDIIYILHNNGIVSSYDFDGKILGGFKADAISNQGRIEFNPNWKRIKELLLGSTQKKSKLSLLPTEILAKIIKYI